MKVEARKRLPIIGINNIKTNNTNSGIYFFGDRGLTIDNILNCAVKYGSADNFKHRISQYKTHSCMLWHESVKHEYSGNGTEYQAQEFIASIAIGRPPYSDEWYIVSEKVYLSLCENPWQVYSEEGRKNLILLAIQSNNDCRQFRRVDEHTEEYIQLYKQKEQLQKENTILKNRIHELENIHLNDIQQIERHEQYRTDISPILQKEEERNNLKGLHKIKLLFI